MRGTSRVTPRYVLASRSKAFMRIKQLVILAAAVGIGSSELHAQQSGGVSIWLGGARALDNKTALTFKNMDLSAAVQLDVPLFPVGIRGEVMAPGSDIS